MSGRTLVALILATGLACSVLSLSIAGSFAEIDKHLALSKEIETLLSTTLGAIVGALATYLGTHSTPPSEPPSSEGETEGHSEGH